MKSVPQELQMHIEITDERSVGVRSGTAPNDGAIFDLAFEVETAGTYFFQFANYPSAPDVWLKGKPAHYLTEEYSFQID